MAIISFTIPDEHMTDLVEAFATRFHYPETVQDPNSAEPSEIPNPQTKAQFAKEQVLNHIKLVYRQYKENQEAEAARAIASAEANADSDTFTEA